MKKFLKILKKNVFSLKISYLTQSFIKFHCHSLRPYVSSVGAYVRAPRPTSMNKEKFQLGIAEAEKMTLLFLVGK